jgi:hypothetical protein
LTAIATTLTTATAQPLFYEKWHATTAGLAVSQGLPSHDFRDMWVGDDMLPYTEDDERLPEFGNPGGTWTASALDSDGDGTADHRFTVARRGSDDMQTYASNSEFQYGVIGESEDWHDFHNADNLGPCFPCAFLDLDECMDADEIPGEDCCQECEPADDFEHNDGFSDWEDRFQLVLV